MRSSKHMAGRLLAIIIGFSMFASVAAHGQAANVSEVHAATFEKYVDAEGNISLPENFALDWSFMGTWAIAGEDSVPDIHNVYTPKEVVESYRANGEFADGAIIVKEVLNARGAPHTTGNAHWANGVKVWFVMIRDTQDRFPDSGNWGDGWGWGLFEGADPGKQVSTDYKEDCLQCHIPAQKDNWIYIYGYPILGETVKAAAPAAEVEAEAEAEDTAAMAAVSAEDIAKGEKVFRRCKTCHTLKPGKHRAGPSLAGVMGREAGTVEGYKASEAMKASNVVWSSETMDAFLADVPGFIPGNKMGKTFKKGLKKPEDRAALNAYLNSLTE